MANPREIAALTRRLAAQARSSHPDYNIFTNFGEGGQGRIKLRRPHWPEGKFIESPRETSIHNDGHAGARTLVSYHRGSQQFPYAGKAALGLSGSGLAAAIVSWALWGQAEGNPFCNRGPITQTDPPTYGALGFVVSTPRLYWDDDFQSGLPDNFLNLIRHEGVTLTGNKAAALVSLYDETGGSIIGYLLREWDFDAEEETDWIHILSTPAGSTPTNNKQRTNGYLFYDQSADRYTIATVEGLALCTRDNAPTPSICYWAHEYGGTPANSSVSVAGPFAIQGAFERYTAAGISPYNTTGNCAVNLYVRGASAWAHVGALSLAASVLDGCDSVRACGTWAPYSESIVDICENTRWPYLSSTQEWVVWCCGTNGDSTRPDLSLSALNFIKASTGAVRSVIVGTSNSLLIHRGGLQDDLIEQLEYQSHHHPENWTGLTGGTPVDTGGANGWATGHVYTSSQMASLNASGLLDDYQPPDEDHVHWGTIAQEITKFTGWTTDYDPTVAKDPSRLDCGFSTPIPRGIVFDSGRKGFFFCRNSNWITSGDYSFGPDAPEYAFIGNYEDFVMGSEVVDGETYAIKLRVYSMERSHDAGFAFPDTVDRLFLFLFDETGLIDGAGFTREFSQVLGDGKTYYYWQRPVIHEYAVAGDYLWVVASDWWAVDDQRLTLILINKVSLIELDRIDLSPGEDRLWDEDQGRPQLLVGVDASNEPWAHVAAWFSGPDRYLVQEVRYISSSLTKETITENDTGDGGFLMLSESVNMAVSADRVYSIHDGEYLART